MVNFEMIFKKKINLILYVVEIIFFVGQNLAKTCYPEAFYLLHLWRFVGKFATRLVQYMLGFNFQLP
jgi:hypothetical protein